MNDINVKYLIAILWVIATLVLTILFPPIAVVTLLLVVFLIAYKFKNDKKKMIVFMLFILALQLSVITTTLNMLYIISNRLFYTANLFEVILMATAVILAKRWGITIFKLPNQKA
jgi:hypothetical protein